MNIIDNGVELTAEEFVQFHRDHCEEIERMVYCHGDYVVGDITAVTNDNRLVIDVDMPADVPLYSTQYSVVKVVRDEGRYAVSIWHL